MTYIVKLLKHNQKVSLHLFILIKPTDDLGWLRHSVITVEHTHTCTHAHFMTLCPGLPRWAGTRKVKPIWILLKQETVSASCISWAICKSAHCCRQITTTAPNHSSFYRLDALPAIQPTPLPLPLTVCCFSKIQIGFTFLVPAHPGSPGKRAVKRVCVCVCVYLVPFSRYSRLLVKSRWFWPTPPAFGTLAGGNPVAFRRDLWHQKTRVPGLSCGVVCVTLCLAVLAELRLVTDGQTQAHG